LTFLDILNDFSWVVQPDTSIPFRASGSPVHCGQSIRCLLDVPCQNPLQSQIGGKTVSQSIRPRWGEPTRSKF